MLKKELAWCALGGAMEEGQRLPGTVKYLLLGETRILNRDDVSRARRALAYALFPCGLPAHF